MKKRVSYLVSTCTKIIDECVTKFKRPPYLYKRGIANKVAHGWSTLIKWQMIGQSGTRKLQMIGQHRTIMPHMIDDQIINESTINILSIVKFIQPAYLFRVQCGLFLS